MDDKKSSVKQVLEGRQRKFNRSKYRMPGLTEPLWVIVDAGNTDVKAMIHGHWGEELVFPHYVRQPNESDYKLTELSYRDKISQFDGTAIFSMRGHGGFIVGRHAAQFGNGVKLLGTEKYRRDHMGALVIAALVQLYPAGHPDVKLVITHPARINRENLRDLWKSVTGRFDITLADGRKCVYNVTEIIPLEEPVASFQTFALNTNGTAYQRERIDLKPGYQFLIADIGGGVSHLVPGIVTRDGSLEINIDAAQPIEVGIEDVAKAFRAEIKSRYKEIRNATLPDDMVYNALMHGGEIIIKGVAYECTQQVTNSMQPLSVQLSRVYHNEFSGGVSAHGIVVAGGGGGVSYDHLLPVFDHPFVAPAEDDIARMRFGGIRGASKGLAVFLGVTNG